MTFIARMLRYVFWVLIVSWAVSILRRIVGNMAGASPTTHPDIDVPNDAVSRKLVRDPVCGMHLAESVAIPLREGGELLHFCSRDCRQKYLADVRKFAANG
jgi:YHS domain-containing protein